MSYRIIQNILDTQLGTVTNVPQLIKENEAGSLTSDADQSSRFESYLRSTLLPAQTAQLTIGLEGFDNFQGLYQVDIFTPYKDGVDGANYIVDQIIDAFPARTQLSSNGITVRIITYWREPSIQYSNYMQLPVTMQWEAHIQRP